MMTSDEKVSIRDFLNSPLNKEAPRNHASHLKQLRRNVALDRNGTLKRSKDTMRPPLPVKGATIAIRHSARRQSFLGKKKIKSTADSHKEEWIQSKLGAYTDEFTDRKELTIYCASWNVGGGDPDEDIGPWLSCKEKPDVYVIAFQEIVDMNISSVVANSHEKALPWAQKILETIGEQQYRQIVLKPLVGILLLVYVQSKHVPFIAHVEFHSAASGLGGFHGNKGGVAARMKIYQSSFCFVACHLAAHKDKVKQRNSDWQTICSKIKFTQHSHVDMNGKVRAFDIFEHDNVWWLGDLNYRLEFDDMDHVHKCINEKSFHELLAKDQLWEEMMFKRAFSGMKEGPIEFAPTYKYTPKTQEYDKKKGRMPAWCDRILYKGDSIKQHEYQRAELMTSDHKPVFSRFSVLINFYDVLKQKAVYDRIAKEYVPPVNLPLTKMSKSMKEAERRWRAQAERIAREKAALAYKVELLEKENDILRSEVEEVRLDVDQLNLQKQRLEKLSKKSQSNDVLSEQNSILQADIVKYESQKNKFNKQIRDLREMNNEVAPLKEENLALRQENEIFAQENEDFQSEVAQLQARLLVYEQQHGTVPTSPIQEDPPLASGIGTPTNAGPHALLPPPPPEDAIPTVDEEKSEQNFSTPSRKPLARPPIRPVVHSKTKKATSLPRTQPARDPGNLTRAMSVGMRDSADMREARRMSEFTAQSSQSRKLEQFGKMNRRATADQRHPPPIASSGTASGIRVVRKPKKDRRFSLTAVQHSRQQLLTNQQQLLTNQQLANQPSRLSVDSSPPTSPQPQSPVHAATNTPKFHPSGGPSPAAATRQPEIEGQWQEALDPNTNQVYYYNAITQETQWEVPPGYNRLRTHSPSTPGPHQQGDHGETFDFGITDGGEDPDALEEMCADCGCVLVDEYLEIGGSKYHTECLRCAKCCEAVSNGEFYMQEDQILCRKDYVSEVALRCALCMEPITDEVWRANKQTWHFFCLNSFEESLQLSFKLQKDNQGSALPISPAPSRKLPQPPSNNFSH